MTDFSRLVRGRTLDPRRAEAEGFRKNGAEYVLRKPLPEFGLLAEITLGEKTLGIRVLEEDGEEFYLLRVGNAAGSFLPAVRDAEEEIAREVAFRVFPAEDAGKRILETARRLYGTVPDAPFDDGGESLALRAENGKWYALVMTVDASKLTEERRGPVRVMNLKVDPAKRDSLWDGRHFFPAYHMNKTHWITVLLDDELDWEKAENVLGESYRLVSGNRKKRREKK